MLNYDAQKDEICHQIASNKASLKIVLKTKNDPFLLPDWVSHHRRAVGARSLIIADNGSTDAAVLSFYREDCSDLMSFQFSGFHNRIHIVSHFRDLYSALHESCHYFQIIDTDERLVAVFDDHVIHNSRINDVLMAECTDPIIVGTWFFNKPLVDNIFTLGRGHAARVLQGGKSLLAVSARTQMPQDRSVNHNHTIPEIQRYVRVGQRTRIGLLHLTRLDPQQRMHANREKLVSRKLIPAGLGFEEIAKLDLPEGYPRSLVNQIQMALDARALAKTKPKGVLGKDSFRIELDGSLTFGSAEVRACYQEVLRNPLSMLLERGKSSRH